MEGDDTTTRNTNSGSNLVGPTAHAGRPCLTLYRPVVVSRSHHNQANAGLHTKTRVEHTELVGAVNSIHIYKIIPVYMFVDCRMYS